MLWGIFTHPRGVTVSHRGVAWAAGPKKRMRQGSEWAVYLVGSGQIPEGVRYMSNHP